MSVMQLGKNQLSCIIALVGIIAIIIGILGYSFVHINILETASWLVLCGTTFYSILKHFRTLIRPILLLIPFYSIPLFVFQQNTPIIKSFYIIFVIAIIVGIFSSYFQLKNKMIACFFGGVIFLFSVFWCTHALPFIPDWSVKESFLERYIHFPLHHSTWVPIGFLLALLIYYWKQSSFLRRVQYLPSWIKRLLPYSVSFVLGIVIFSMTSQIPEIFKYGTPFFHVTGP